MTARFPNMIGIMRTSIKTGLKSCEVPANKLCINVLRLFRDRGYIFGFNTVSPRKKNGRLYPRVKIHFKYSDSSAPVIKDLSVFKNTYSNFTPIRVKNQYQILSQHKIFLLTTPKGLLLTSFTDLSSLNKSQKNFHFGGKLLLEIYI
jgi:ribosomal protein S8